MKKIASFQVDHTCMSEGLYISRVDGDIVTYDIRMIKPNTPPYLDMSAVHTLEHIFATYARNQYEGNIIYFGPMGCRTGFYLLTKGLAHECVISLVRQAMQFIAAFQGDIPGVSAAECGNYQAHDLPKAKEYAVAMGRVLENWQVAQLEYASSGLPTI